MGSLTPFHCTTDAETKLLPVTVNVNEGAPRVTVLGETDEILGTGFGGGGGGGGGGGLPPPPHEQSKIERNRAKLIPGRQKNRRLFMERPSRGARIFVAREVNLIPLNPQSCLLLHVCYCKRYANRCANVMTVRFEVSNCLRHIGEWAPASSLPSHDFARDQTALIETWHVVDD